LLKLFLSLKRSLESFYLITGSLSSFLALFLLSFNCVLFQEMNDDIESYDTCSVYLVRWCP
jgi:hypothetical protein